jgi:hypothetical protein
MGILQVYSRRWRSENWQACSDIVRTMIKATSGLDGSIMTLNASVNGPVAYLDNWALIELAKKDPSRRRRFIDAVRGGADVLFSVTNAAELSGPKGRSAEALKTFLDEIGPHWFPAKLSPMDVIDLEIRREDPGKVCFDEEFFKSYVADRMRSFEPGCGKVMELSDDFFSLGPMMDRLGPQWKSIHETSVKFDQMLKQKMTAARQRSKRDPSWLDKNFPCVPFDPARPACFVFFNLLRMMAVESNSLTTGDGLDFCHAVIGCAFANFTTLDTTWKRRIANLPKPNGLARVYSRAELDQMVADIETHIATPARAGVFVLREFLRKQLTGSVGPCRIIARSIHPVGSALPTIKPESGRSLFNRRSA